MRKIPTLFVRDEEDRRRVTRDVTPGCEWVLEGEGKATRKYDGTCVMLDEHGKWWARREVKEGAVVPPEYHRIETDETTGKTVGWQPASDSPFSKFLDEALSHPWNQGIEPGTFELLGPKINKNPEGVGQHDLVRHGYLAAVEWDDYRDAPRDFDGIWRWLWSHEGIEGIVWHHPDGRMAKIKRRDFPSAPPEETPASALPEVIEDESGGVYFAPGHVDPVAFLFAVVVDTMCNVGSEEAMHLVTSTSLPNYWRTSIVDERLAAVQHVWFRFDNLPTDDEHMALCSEEDEGALPFTRLVL